MRTRSLRMSLPQVGEFNLIQSLRRRYGQTGRAVLRGIGDDAAMVRASSAHALLITTDLVVEGIHFNLHTATFADIGYKAAVANLSDIAAMGGTPQYLLASVAVPRSCTASNIDDLYGGLMRACRPHGVELVGGDTSESKDGLFVSVTVTGCVEPGRALRRDGAKVGDLVYVTGTLGDSLAGLRILTRKGRRQRRTSGREGANPRYVKSLVDRHLHPTARLQTGLLLAHDRLATAAIDISDGLSGDLAHVCRESGVGAEIEAAAVPLSDACRAYAVASGVDPIDWALRGGEDYELLFTVPPRNCSKLGRVSQRSTCRITRIGTIRPRAFGLRLRRQSGRVTQLVDSSYQHFQAARTTPREAAWSS